MFEFRNSLNKSVNYSFSDHSIPDDRMFSDTGNILCGKPFPRSDNIRFVDRMLYSEDFNGANQDELDAMPSESFINLGLKL